MSLHGYAIGIIMPTANQTDQKQGYTRSSCIHLKKVSIMLTTSTAEKLTDRDCEVSMVSWVLHFPHGDLVLLATLNSSHITELCFMLLWTDYSRSSAGIVDTG